MPTQQMTVKETLLDAVSKANAQLGLNGEKFFLEHVDEYVTTDLQTFALRDLANTYVEVYDGSFRFMLDMKETQRFHALTMAQLRGVLNIMLAETMRRPGGWGTGQVTAPVTEDGMYMMPNGDIYKAQFNRASGDGRRLYAKRLVVTSQATFDEDGHVLQGATIRFDYVAGAIRNLTPEMKMTMGQARAFGALYGTCVRCGRTLTREESIERAMGPVCVRYFA